MIALLHLVRVIYDDYSILWHFIKNHSATSLLEPQKKLSWGSMPSDPLRGCIRTCISRIMLQMINPPLPPNKKSNQKSCMKTLIIMGH